MGLKEWLKKSSDSADKEYESGLKQETAKVRAYRAAEDVVLASERLMMKAKELRAEIEALENHG
jgi:hypothetical protein